MTTTSPINPFDSALSMAQAIKDGKVTSRQLVEMYIDRIERLDTEINAIVQRDFEGARQRADRADTLVQEWKKNPKEVELGVFHGVPMTIKEAHPTPGFSMCNGDPAPYARLPSWTKCTNATLILEEGGVVLMGKSNVPINSSDWECNNPVYGRTKNPYNLERTPGGSSGGGSAALAAGLTPIEFGSDIGGSIRIPAVFCGVVGHCATRGAIPKLDFQNIAGLACCSCVDHLVNKIVDDCAWMARAGPMARNVDDVVAMLELIGGDVMEALQKPKDTSTLADYRVGVWRTHEKFQVGSEVKAAMDKAVAALEKAGATVVELDPPMDPMETYKMYLLFLSSFMKLHIPREQRNNAKKGRPQDSYPSDIRSPFAEMDLATVNGIPKDTFDALEKADATWDPYLKSFDAVLAPIFPCEAYPNGNDPRAALSDAKTCSRKLLIDDKEVYYGDCLFWPHLPAVLGLPATGFPVGFTQDGSGIPIGLQAVGAKGMDFIVLDIVKKLMRELGTDKFSPPPDFE